MKRIISMLLTILMISLMIVSCNDPAAQPSDTTASVGTGETSGDTTAAVGGDTEEVTTAGVLAEPEEPFKPETPVVLDLVKNGKVNAKIIYPDGDKVAQNTVNELRRKIISKLGVNVTAASDAKVAADSNALEILVGYTNRPESQNISKFIGYRDHGVFVVGNKLIVAGWFDDSLVKAVEKFESLYLSGDAGDKSLSVSSDDNFVSSAYYQMSSLFSKQEKARKIAGNYYFKYKIVLPEDYSFTEYRFAQRIQTLLGTKTGTVLPIVDDTAAASDYEILIGNTNRTQSTVGKHKYLINVKDNKVEMLSDSYYGYDYLFEYCEISLISGFNKAVKNSGAITDADYESKLAEDGSESFISKSGELRIIFNNVFGFNGIKGMTTPNLSCMPELRNPMIAEFYSDFGADVLCFEEITSVMRATSSVTRLMEEYGYKEVSAGRCTTPILYNENTIELIEGGEKNFNEELYVTGRCPYSIQSDKYMTWAVFKVKATGEKFAVINVHMDSFDDNGDGTGAVEAAAQVELMLETANEVFTKHSCPMLIGGDFNTTISEQTYKTFVNNINNYADVQAIAEKTDNNKGHFSGVPCMQYNACIGGGFFTGSSQTSDRYSESVDHIYVSPYAKSVLTFNRFDILSDSSVASFADHCGMVLDFSFN